ncbi:MAG: coenzyme F420-0:L-glutamate ligase [Thermosphaera sp.]
MKINLLMMIHHASYREVFGHRVVIKVFKKPFRYWYPGVDIVKEILNKYRDHLVEKSIVAISEKAISVALGNIYDESLIKPDPISKCFTKIVNAYLWGRVLYKLFRHSEEFLEILQEIPLDYLTSHKKLSVVYGGLIHFIKPYSEAGIDTTNLPYYYVSLPLKNADKVARSIREDLIRSVNKNVQVLVLDSDRTFKPKSISNLAISTRPSFVDGIIDLGGLGYLLGRLFPKSFTEYPTPVAYDGEWLGLPQLLKISKIAEKSMGHGLGRTAIQMLKNIGRRSFNEVKWRDMSKIKHYPVLILTINKSTSKTNRV